MYQPIHHISGSYLLLNNGTVCVKGRDNDAKWSICPHFPAGIQKMDHLWWTGTVIGLTFDQRLFVLDLPGHSQSFGVPEYIDWACSPGEQIDFKVFSNQAFVVGEKAARIITESHNLSNIVSAIVPRRSTCDIITIELEDKIDYFCGRGSYFIVKTSGGRLLDINVKDPNLRYDVEFEHIDAIVEMIHWGPYLILVLEDKRLYQCHVLFTEKLPDNPFKPLELPGPGRVIQMLPMYGTISFLTDEGATYEFYDYSVLSTIEPVQVEDPNNFFFERMFVAGSYQFFQCNGGELFVLGGERLTFIPFFNNRTITAIFDVSGSTHFVTDDGAVYMIRSNNDCFYSRYYVIPDSLVTRVDFFDQHPIALNQDRSLTKSAQTDLNQNTK